MEGTSNNQNYCRVCLMPPSDAPDKSFKNIYKECISNYYSFYPNTTSIAKELARLAVVEISKEDGLSRIICKVCYRKLSIALKFIYDVRKTAAKLSNKILDKNLTLNETERGVKKANEVDSEELKPIYDPESNLELVNEKTELVDKKPESDNEKPKLDNKKPHTAKEAIANDTWPKPIEWDKDVNEVLKPPFDVEIKQEAVSDEEGMDFNEYSSLGSPQLDIKEEPVDEDESMPIQITVNGTITEDQHKRIAAMTNGDDVYENVEYLVKEEPCEDIPSDLQSECLLCLKQFRTVAGLRAHVISDHDYKGVKRKAECADNNTSPSKVRATSGQGANERQQSYTCPTCKRTFQTSTDLRVHGVCHTQYCCYACSQQCASFPELSAHRARCKVGKDVVVKPKTLNDAMSASMVLRHEKYRQYRCCIVRGCGNTSIKTPGKLWISLPKEKKRRKAWLQVIGRDVDSLSAKYNAFFCEDHFDLENDMENYMEYKIMGSVKRIHIKPNCLPSRFDCHTGRQRPLTPTPDDTLWHVPVEMDNVSEANTQMYRTEMSTSSLHRESLITEETVPPSCCSDLQKEVERNEIMIKRADELTLYCMTCDMHFKDVFYLKLHNSVEHGNRFGDNTNPSDTSVVIKPVQIKNISDNSLKIKTKEQNTESLEAQQINSLKNGDENSLREKQQIQNTDNQPTEIEIKVDSIFEYAVEKQPLSLKTERKSEDENDSQEPIWADKDNDECASKKITKDKNQTDRKTKNDSTEILIEIDLNERNEYGEKIPSKTLENHDDENNSQSADNKEVLQQTDSRPQTDIIRESESKETTHKIIEDNIQNKDSELEIKSSYKEIALRVDSKHQTDRKQAIPLQILEEQINDLKEGADNGKIPEQIDPEQETQTVDKEIVQLETKTAVRKPAKLLIVDMQEISECESGNQSSTDDVDTIIITNITNNYPKTDSQQIEEKNKVSGETQNEKTIEVQGEKQNSVDEESVINSLPIIDSVCSITN